jgi:hypothetical protein
MEAILQDIQERITSELTQFKYVDEDWGQLDYYSPNFPVKFPCVLIDMLQIQWDNAGNKIQQGISQIQIKIADVRLSNSSGNAPVGQKNKSKSFYALTQAIYNCLHGWSSNENHYSALIRMSEQRVQRDDGVKVYKMIFTTQIKDVSASKVLSRTPRPTIKFNTSKL